MLSGAILFNGASPTKVLRVLSSISVASISFSTFAEHQRKFLQPAICSVWEHEQGSLLQEVKQDLVIGGDARNDSPGHTAKYGSYTFMELNLKKLIHIELVQVGMIFVPFFIRMKNMAR